MNNTRKTVLVIGAGAAGCMAALGAAKAGAQVVLLEGNSQIARKIYATGNGRCNLTNSLMTPECYYQSRPDGTPEEILQRMEAFDHRALLDFLKREGIYCHERAGYWYPRTDQAAVIAAFFEKALQQASVEIHLEERVTSLTYKESGTEGRFTVETLKKTQKESKHRSKNAALAAENRDKREKIVKEKIVKEKILKEKNIKEKNLSNLTNKNPSNKAFSDKNPLHGKSEAEMQSVKGIYTSDKVILCTGGMAAPSMGSTGDGYTMAGRMGHSIIKPVPALTYLLSDEPCLSLMAGVRCDARVTLQIRGRELRTERGELQLTGQGLSGIPVFQLSRVAARYLAQEGEDIAGAVAGALAGAVTGAGQVPQAGTAAMINVVSKDKPGPKKEAIDKKEIEKQRKQDKAVDTAADICLLVDFLPEFSTEEWNAICQERMRRSEKENMTLEQFYLGLVHQKVLDALLSRHGLCAENKTGKLWQNGRAYLLEEIFRDMRHFQVSVKGTGNWEKAQVTAGGIPLDEIGADFESLKQPGLYLAGEILDVDGICGGYNLQWAFSSGWQAGQGAGGKENK